MSSSRSRSGVWLIGAGRSEIARGITRLEGAARGRIWLNRQEISPRDYADCIARGIVDLSEDRKADGVFLNMPIAANVAALDLRRVSGRLGVIDSTRKAALAKLLAVRPKVIFLDEPTRGVEVGALAAARAEP